MSDSVKIVVHVPIENTEAVIKAMGDAGAGKIGNYTHCSFVSNGTGSFLAGEGANPAIGVVGSTKHVAESRVEMTCDTSLVKRVIAAAQKVHPYEEPTFDVYERLSFEEL